VTEPEICREAPPLKVTVDELAMPAIVKVPALAVTDPVEITEAPPVNVTVDEL